MTALVPVLAAAAAFFFALLALDVLRRAFEQYRRRYVTRAVDDLGAMFLFLEPRQVLVLNLAALFFLATAGWIAAGALAGAAAAVGGFFAPSLLVRFYRQRRVRRFDAQFAEALQQLANALRAGFTLQQAMDQVGRDALPPLRHEFGLFTKEVKLGVPVDTALANLAARVGSDDLELMATSTSIARQLGANLAEMLETTAATIRERFRLEGKIRALTSQGKLQGLIVACLPLCVGIFFDAYRPDLIEPMFEHAFGYLLVASVVLLESIGFLVIRRIVEIEV